LQCYFPQIINNQPTAYNVEKVVEELDDYTMWRKLLIYNLTPRDVGIIEKTIEIVRNGGKE
jgi:hypothetical protein